MAWGCRVGRVAPSLVRVGPRFFGDVRRARHGFPSAPEGSVRALHQHQPGAHLIKEAADALLVKLPAPQEKRLKAADGYLSIELGHSSKFEANPRASGQAVLQVHRCPRRG